jgi:hypothetical protein
VKRVERKLNVTVLRDFLTSEMKLTGAIDAAGRNIILTAKGQNSKGVICTAESASEVSLTRAASMLTPQCKV